MIKRNIKMRVTPDESKQVQEICFANGIFWERNYNNIISNNYLKNLYIGDTPYLTFCTTEGWFKKHKYEEVDAKFFIKTKGTCIEETPKQELKQN